MRRRPLVPMIDSGRLTVAAVASLVRVTAPCPRGLLAGEQVMWGLPIEVGDGVVVRR